MIQRKQWLKLWQCRASILVYMLASTLASVIAETKQTGFLWGVNGGVVWFRESIARANPLGSEWTKMDGNLSYVSASARGRTWGVTNNGKAVIRVGITPQNLKGVSWKEVESLSKKAITLKQIAVAANYVWAVGQDNSTFYRKGVSQADHDGVDWEMVDGPGSIQHVALSENGQLWGIDIKNQAVMRQGLTSHRLQGLRWKVIASDKPLKQLAVSENGIWAIGTDYTIWFRKNVSDDNPEGTEWIKVDGLLSHISISLTGLVWGVDAAGMVYFRDGISDTDPVGKSWSKLPGRLVQLEGGHFMVPVVIPEGFEKTTGLTESIAVGSRNGVMEAWCIGLDGSALYRYNPSAATSVRWERVEVANAQGQPLPTPLRKVSVSPDGIMCVVDAGGNVLFYDWDKKVFNNATEGSGNQFFIDHISAGNKDNIWAIDDNKNILQYSSSRWISRADGVGKGIAAGSDGTVLSLQKDGTVYRYLNGKWQAMPGMTFDKLAVGSNDHILGIADNALYQYIAEKWQAVKSNDGKDATGLNTLAVNAMGAVFVTDLADNIYYKAGSQGATVSAPAAAVASIAAPVPSEAAPDAAPTPKSVATPDKGTTAPAPAKGLIIIPEDFDSEVGATENIAVGSRDGQLEAWCISFDGKSLMRYDQYSMAHDPWVRMTAVDDRGKELAQPLEGITVSSDGSVMCVLDHKGRGYIYDWSKKVFIKMLEGSGNEGLTLESISAGNKDNIIAIDGKNRNILQYTTAGWNIIQKGEAICSSVGADGTLVAVNEVGKVYSYLGDGKWKALPGVRLARVAVVNVNEVWGIGVGGEIYKYTGNVAGRAVALASPTPSEEKIVIANTQSKENEWKPRKRLKKGAKNIKKGAAGKKAFLKKGAGKKAHKKSHKKAVIKKPVEEFKTSGVTPDSENKWIHLKGKGGALTIGIKEIAANAAGTVFITDVNNDIYHNGDAGFAVSKVVLGKVEGKPVEPSPEKMTRRRAAKAGKLNINNSKKRYLRGRKNPEQKKKSRLVKKAVKVPRTKKAKKRAKAPGKKSISKETLNTKPQSIATS